jgi:hypothetical protein
MADTSIQREIEDWIREKWIPSQFRQGFSQKNLTLSSGGFFKFDAVSDDEMIVANISTSNATTARGKLGVGKMQKIRADMYFLLLLPNEKRKLLIFTESDMVESCNKEKGKGRIPLNIEIYHAIVPQELRMKLQSSKKIASDEVSPKAEID